MLYNLVFMPIIYWEFVKSQSLCGFLKFLIYVDDKLIVIELLIKFYIKLKYVFHESAIFS